MKRLVCRAAAITCVLLVLPAIGAAQDSGEIIAGRFLVTFQADVPAPAGVARELSRAHGFTVRHVYRYALRGMAIEVPAGADLTWSGAGSTNVDILRNGAKIVTTLNDGFHTDNINKKVGGTYKYKVCEAGTSICSNEATVTF